MKTIIHIPMKTLEWMGLDSADSRKPQPYMLWKGNPITFPTWAIEKSIQMAVKGKSFHWFWILCCLLEGWEATACICKTSYWKKSKKFNHYLHCCRIFVSHLRKSQILTATLPNKISSCKIKGLNLLVPKSISTTSKQIVWFVS